MRNTTYRQVIRRSSCFLLSSFLAIASGRAQTQPSAQTNAARPIADASLVTLKGNTLPFAQAKYDRGPAPGSMAANRLMLILKRSPRQESDLQAYLQSVQKPGSPDFRKFLSPEEFGKRYGLADADLDEVQAWLRGQGFSIAKVNKGRTAIEFSGTVGKLEQAFHTPIHRFQADGVEHWANTTDPQIPAALAQVVAEVASLNDFKPRSTLIMGPAGTWDAQHGRFAPDLTITSGTTPYLFVGPGDAATIYDSPNSLNTKLASGQTVFDGTGVTIGIVGDTPLDDSGPTFYDNFFGLPGNNGPTTIYDGDGGPNFNADADETEAVLDAEVSGALAPGAKLIYYGAGDTEFQAGLFLAIYRAIDDNNVDILSVSYEGCEAGLGEAGNLQVLNAWEQAAAQGITVTVAAGDAGSAGCDNFDTQAVAREGLAVNGLASTPYNIAVGGTDFDILADKFTTYVTGINSANYTSALGYIPENPWNDSTKVNGLLSANTPYSNSSGATNIVAGGGGASSLGAGVAGYPKPLWQQTFAPSNTDAVRDLPDVSLLAANGQYQALWALCIDGDCADGADSTIHGVGGTSAAAPAFAGILAMVNQAVGASTRLGQANWVLYKLAQTSPSAFHQITTGNNSVFCATSSLNCGANQFLTGYNAGSGYSLATGLGSVDASVLVNNWSSDALDATTTTLGLSKTSFAHGTPVTVTAGVTPAAATGNVAIINNYTSQPQASTSVSPFNLPLSNGSASGSYSELPGGTYNVYANYGGDGTHAGSTSQPVQVTVSPEDSVLNFTIDYLNSNSKQTNAAGQSIPLGATLTMDAQPVGESQAGKSNPITNATGAVVLTDTDAPGSGPLGNLTLDSTGNGETSLIGLNAGSYSITASYPGDLSYNPSNAGPISFTVLKAPTTITVTSSASSIFAGNLNLDGDLTTTVPFNSAVSSTTGGLVTFTDSTNNTILGTGAANDVSQCPNATTLCFGAPLQVNVSQFAVGANSIVASYAGAANFDASGPSAPFVVTCIAGCANALGETLALGLDQESNSDIAPGGTVTATIDLNPGGGFLGAVNMTCSIKGTNSSDVHVPTCSFNPAQVNVTSNQAASSILTISTTAPVTTALNIPSDTNAIPGRWISADSTALATLLLLGFAPRRFRRRYLMGLLGIALACGCMSACGGSGSGGGGGGGGTTIPGTTADTYTVTFNAADAATGTVTAENNFTFKVN